MIYFFVYLLFNILICVLIYNTIAPTVLYNYILVFFTKQGRIEKQYFTELCFTLYKYILIIIIINNNNVTTLLNMDRIRV